jgi:hypothetical protein
VDRSVRQRSLLAEPNRDEHEHHLCGEYSLHRMG